MIDVSVTATTVVCMVVMYLYWRSIAIGDREFVRLHARDHEAMEYLRSITEDGGWVRLWNQTPRGNWLFDASCLDDKATRIETGDPADAILIMKASIKEQSHEHRLQRPLDPAAAKLGVVDCGR